MFLKWGFLSFHFLIYNIDSTSSPKLTYSDLFLFTTASFQFLVYNIKVTFSAKITYFNLIHFTTASFHFLIYNLNITFSTTHTHFNIFLFGTPCFTPLWYVSIKIWIVCVNCCSTFSGFLIHKTGFLEKASI